LTDLLERSRSQAEEIERRRKEADVANRSKTSSSPQCRTSYGRRSTPSPGTCSYSCWGGPVTEEQTTDLMRIQRSQQHLLSLINDVLNFSRLEAGAVTYDIASVPLGAVMDAAANMIHPQANSKHITFTLEPCLPSLTVLADASKLEQILLNLLTNAVKFTQAGGHVSIACEAVGDRVLAHVQDNGPGIPADRLGVIFEPFVQLNRTLGNPGDGAGLGLAISRDLARGMEGDLTVRAQ
jgi:signal transduction histidine kinase